jgi:hypothetical protein
VKPLVWIALSGVCFLLEAGSSGEVRAAQQRMTLVGVWQVDDLNITFRVNGTMRIQRGTDPAIEAEYSYDPATKFLKTFEADGTRKGGKVNWINPNTLYWTEKLKTNKEYKFLRIQ